MKQHFGKYLGPTLIDEQEPITAWRIWRVNDKGKLPLLHSMNTGQLERAWLPNVATIAECLAQKRCHLGMGPKCTCGLWGTKQLSGLVAHGAMALYPQGALGQVHLWGFVHVYRHGVRAQLGRPARVWLGNTDGRDFAERLYRSYRIPCELGLPMELVAQDPGFIARPSEAPMVNPLQSVDVGGA